MLLVSDLEATGGRDADLAYMRVAGDIAARIASGELKPGARLRAERDLAEHYESLLRHRPPGHGSTPRARADHHDPRERDVRLRTR